MQRIMQGHWKALERPNQLRHTAFLSNRKEIQRNEIERYKHRQLDKKAQMEHDK